MNTLIELDEVWSEVKGCLQAQLSPSFFQTFLSSVTPRDFTDSVLGLDVPNQFSQEWFKEKCEPILQHHLTKYPKLLISYRIVDSVAPDDHQNQLDMFKAPPKPKTQDQAVLNEKYTFDNFIVGHNNRFSYAASEAVSKSPSKTYNPLFLYGSVGLGKTHLLHAICLRIKQDFPHLSIIFVSSEKFTNEMINSIKDKKVEAFRSKYRKADVLVIDDVQFLAGKEQTQIEFFHTFNDLHCCNKQIILTSDRPPKEIPALEVRLRTRFEWGLMADMQPPEFETRIAILRKKAEMNQFTISDEILHFIATQIPSNVREMEGALTRIVAYASLLNTDITLAIASNVIRDLVGIKQEQPLSISHIKRTVAEYFNISEVELCSKNRSRDLSYARQVAMYLSRELTTGSLPKIGENFGNRDHTTVMHACDKIKSLLLNDGDTQSIVQLLITTLKKEG